MSNQSTSPPYSPGSFPAQWCAVSNAVGNSLTYTIPTPPTGLTFVLEGIDAAVGFVGQEGAAWYTINPGGIEVRYATWGAQTDPLVAAHPVQWRGALPWGNGQTVEVGIDCLTPFADLKIVAWGSWYPTPLYYY